jgi:hypothetical protein
MPSIICRISTTPLVSARRQGAIEEGLDDIRASRTITIEEYRRTRGL